MNFNEFHKQFEALRELEEREKRDDAMSALAEQPKVKPKRTVTYVCPVCAASRSSPRGLRVPACAS